MVDKVTGSMDDPKPQSAAAAGRRTETPAGGYTEVHSTTDFVTETCEFLEMAKWVCNVWGPVKTIKRQLTD